MNEMFCFQCEQTVRGTCCTRGGACGKNTRTAQEQDRLTAALVDLARAAGKGQPGPETGALMMKGLLATATNVNFDSVYVTALREQVEERTRLLGGAEPYDRQALWLGEPDALSLRSTLLFGLRGMAAYALRARALGCEDAAVTAFLYEGMEAVGSARDAEGWLELLARLGHVNLACMALLDRAQTEAFGRPVPTRVSMAVEKGPFIVVTGHDLEALRRLLEQTRNRGIHVYTHGEMLPAHGYPKLRQYPHLKGNFGTAWQNQRREFEHLPAAVLFTTNCLMPPLSSYSDRIFTLTATGYPGVRHLDTPDDGPPDFEPVIEKALALGGWAARRRFAGMNGGCEMTTGYGHDTVLGVADLIADHIRSGLIRHFFLVGGCDGAKSGRSYYTDFVKNAPDDTVVLTLACGKYRFNDLNLGNINGIPRLMDMGQCSDLYSAIRVIRGLAEKLRCAVSELPVTPVLSWYEQKSVCNLLTMLTLGLRGVYLGPSLPAFLSPGILNLLMEKYALRPVTTPEADLVSILG